MLGVPRTQQSVVGEDHVQKLAETFGLTENMTDILRRYRLRWIHVVYRARGTNG